MIFTVFVVTLGGTIIGAILGIALVQLFECVIH